MLALILVLLIDPSPHPILVHCDTLELNHLHDSQARHCFTQLIGWNWDDGQKHVDWYVIVDDKTTFHLNGSRKARLIKEHRWYTLEYTTFKETWRQWDVEREDLNRWPKEWRRELPK